MRVLLSDSVDFVLDGVVELFARVVLRPSRGLGDAELFFDLPMLAEKRALFVVVDFVTILVIRLLKFQGRNKLVRQEQAMSIR